MIKRMESEHVRIGMAGNDIILTINGLDHMLNIDQLGELREITTTYWDANGLWNQTTAAKAEREQWKDERVGCLTGLAQRALDTTE